ncbi:MAG: hypothetical protein ACJ75R_11625 [Solirubrobacterales bacterium]
MSLDEAIVELRANSGTQFDPLIVEALVGIIETWRAPDTLPTSVAVPA